MWSLFIDLFLNVYSGWRRGKNRFLLLGGSESRGEAMAYKRNTTGEPPEPRVQWEPWRRGGRSRKSLKGDHLKAESWRTWPGQGWWRINQAEGAGGAEPSPPPDVREPIYLGNWWGSRWGKRSDKQGALKTMKGLEEFLARMWHF